MKGDWVSVGGLPGLEDALGPITRALEKKFRSGNISAFIYKNPALLVTEKVSHSSRQITGEGVLPDKLMSRIRREHFNLVFLFVMHLKPSVYVLVKPTHNLFESEIWLSGAAAKAEAGPKFLFSMDSSLGVLIFEEFLSDVAGWRKLYEVWPSVMKHKALFAKCFGSLLGRLHRKAVLYGEIFDTHLFLNLTLHACRLTDFGISRHGLPDELDEELGKALQLLRGKMFPEKEQAGFLDAYSRHRKLPKGIAQVKFI